VLVTRPSEVRRHRFNQERALHGYLVSEHVMEVLTKRRVNVVLDVGGNAGQYAQMLRRAGYKGRIISFEPVPEMAKRLEEIAARDRRWTVQAVALGREDGITTMNVVPGSLSSVLPASDFGAQRYARLREPVAVEVPVRRLDGMLDALLEGVKKPRTYLKMDTQGFDLEVFAGLGERTRDIVALQSEVAVMQIYAGMPRMPEALAAYEAAGFEMTGLFPVTRERKSGRVVEFDCVMIRYG
jgi:FkbM family methyltransferase